MIPQTRTAVDKITTATVDAINQEHEAATRAAGEALRHAMRCGELLIEAKRGVAHGEWQTWLVHNFHGSPRTARAYMRLAEHRDRIESKTAGHAVLSIGAAMRLLSKPNKQDPFPTTENLPPGAWFRYGKGVFYPNGLVIDDDCTAEEWEDIGKFLAQPVRFTALADGGAA